ncbi:uncharacterized protein LOC116027503 isoform X2 [Ipomoea triloba]|uniref:uncharacterized protein LOC116027503 isoform X2 n=1 Tax=Ipomoea triloba TaxID=35885 RepID=UPI00125DEE40|nr:uncharacterized protein LOC116027503 isoform X2 [Ipomoea triloba]
MNLLLLSGGGGASSLPSSHIFSLKFIQPIPPLFSSIFNHASMPKIRPNGASRPTSPPSNAAGDDAESSLTQDRVPLRGVIQKGKPNSSSPISKWGKVALLAGGDVAALLLFSALERFSYGFEVFDFETMRTADPFIVGWFLSASFLGGYGEDGRGMNGLSKACIAATKSCALGIPLGLVLRAATVDHILPLNFITVTMGSAALLLIGWRTLLLSILPDDQKKKNDVYKRDTPFELFEMSHNSTRRYHDDLTFHHRDRRREEISILEPSAENLKVPPSLSLLQRDRPNSLGMSNGYIEQPNIIRTPTFTPEWQMQVPHSPESIESPLDGPSGGKELIIPVEKNGFYPAKSNRAVMVCIKKYFTKAVKTYREASPELKEVWFNEFRKRYTWREEHNTNIRRIFDAKASNQLRNTLTDIRKSWRMNKPPPKWISPEIYKDLKKLWDEDFSDIRSEPSKVIFVQGRELITPVGEKGFYPAKANRAIMGCIMKHFTKAVKSYREAPPELKEVWFNEFKKTYIWREEHNTNIRRNFDAKASNQLRNTLTGIRKARRMNKPPPKCISPQVYKDLEQLWDDPEYITKCEILKQALNTVHVDDRPSSLYTDGSIPMSKRGQELITLDGKGGFHPAKVNGAIMGCIKKHFTKAVETYREVPPELKEVWFNEFRKMYIWKEEDETNIRRTFDAKASNQLLNNLIHIRKRRLENKSPPKWISLEIYKELEQLWDDYR